MSEEAAAEPSSDALRDVVSAWRDGVALESAHAGERYADADAALEQLARSHRRRLLCCALSG